MKCKNCSNLMQYYNKPINSDIDELFLSIDRFMACVDNIYEFRILGGDPFMNKDLYKVVGQLKKYEQVKKIIVYTNAKIIPKGANLDCLKHKKVVLDITNYGEGLRLWPSTYRATVSRHDCSRGARQRSLSADRG